MRKITSSIAAIGLVGSLNAYALGIGDITTHSALNQLLNAKISVSSSKEDDPKNLYVKLASSDVFSKAGIEKPAFLLDLKFEPVINKNGQISINVSSETPIKEPFVNFILEVEWPKGRTLKEYTILLDPPISMQDIQPKQSRVSTTPLTEEKPLPLIVTEQTAATEKKLTQIPTPVAISKQKYGPIKSNDTIWAIAKGLAAQAPEASHEQIMIALYNNNPNAFYKKNVSALKRGAILRIPTAAEINANTAKEANAEFNKQNRSWASAKSLKLEKVTTAPTKKNKPVSNTPSKNTNLASQQTKNTEPEKAKLTLLTADKTDITKPSTGKATDQPTDNAQEINNANLAIEMAISSRQERKELQSRLTDMEAQLEKLQRLLLLKDKQFAQLQTAQQNRSIEKVENVEKPEQVKAADPTNDSENYLTYAGGALFVGLLSLFLARRKKEDSEDNAFTNLDDFNNDNDQIDEPNETDEPVINNEELSEKPVYETEPTDSEESTLFSEFTPSEFSDSANNTEADPLTECDVYIAYGRFQQAEDLIQKAIDERPENPLYLLKLLEVHFASKNTIIFEEFANDLSYLEQSEPELWEKVTQMRQELLPNSQLPSSYDTGENEQDETLIADDEPPTTKEAKEDDFSFDFDLIDTKTPQNDEVDDIEFDLDSLDLDSDLENSVDTKLSLAEAYIDMEDYNSAKEALDEVIDTGSAEQVEKAKQLLGSLAG